MSKWEKLRSKILSGQCDGNIDFAELVNYLQRCGFDLRTLGSHNLFAKNGIDVLSISNLTAPRRNAIKCVKFVIFLIQYQIDQPKEAANE